MHPSLVTFPIVKDVETLERVQKNAKNLIPILRKHCYEEKLKVLGLTTLKIKKN